MHRDLTGQTAHERQLLSDMGHLESQLESWKQAEQSLEHQVAEQAVFVNKMQAEEAKAIHDEQVAAVVWWDCKMLVCLMVASSLAFCVYSSSSNNFKPSFNAAAEQAPQPVRRARPQPEFIEKDVQQQAEDILQVTLPRAEHVDLEAPSDSQLPKEDGPIDPVSLQPPPSATCGDDIDQESKGDSLQARRDSCASQCQYFCLDEDPTPDATGEEAWWASGY